MTIFAKIIDRQIPADIVYEDDRALAFRDIRPVAPVHILVIPKQPIPTARDVESAHAELVGHLVVVARRVAEAEGIAASGYRLVINCGDHGGQTVYHLHVHLIGGMSLGWPPFPDASSE